VTGEARELLRAVLATLDGESWGPTFDRVVRALESSGSDLVDPLAAAGMGDDTAWRMLLAEAGEGDGIVLLDLAAALAARRAGTVAAG
jgi:hypothetical protein